MRLIYSQGFNKNERLEWKPVVFSNIIQSFRTISEAMTELQYGFDTPDNEVRFFSSLLFLFFSSFFFYPHGAFFFHAFFLYKCAVAAKVLIQPMAC